MILKQVKGMTLVELLIVIVIMMTLLSIVGGSTVSSVDRVKAQGELISLHNLIKMASVRAFSAGAGTRLHLNNSKIFFSVGEADLTERKYEYLKFPEQVLIFNRNGYPDSDVLIVSVRSKDREIDLVPLLSGPREANE